MSKRIIIFGVLNTGKKAFQMMKSKYEIIAFSDNCVDYHGEKLFDIPIISPETILSLQADLIVIASMNHSIEIAQQLTGIGIKNLKLFQFKSGVQDYLLVDVDGKKPFQNCIYRKAEINSYDKKKISQECRFKRNKKVLVIAYYFPPAGGSPIQRTLKFVKYMQEYGYEPIVLTTETNSYINRQLIDESLLADIPKDIQIIRIKDEFAWTNTISRKKSQEIVEFLYSISDSEEWMNMFVRALDTQPWYILPDKLILWANECVRHINQYIDINDIDLLYSTVPEWSPHLIAYFLKQEYGIKWVADYRDPWVSNEDYIKLYYPWMSKEEILLDRTLEKTIAQKMDSIIVAGGKWAADFVTNYNIAPQIIKEITNGYDEEDFIDLYKNTEKNKKFTLCYNGAVGYNRNPIPLIKILNALIDEDKLKRNEVQWIFNGPITDSYLTEISLEDKYHIVILNGMLPHKESIQIAINADIMVMYGEFGEKGKLNYPGKFYEYLRIGRPILCFSSEDSFQAKVLQETEIGINLDLYETESISEFLQNQIIMWRSGKKINIGNKEVIQKYERKNLTKLLIKEFDRLLKE